MIGKIFCILLGAFFVAMSGTNKLIATPYAPDMHDQMIQFSEYWHGFYSSKLPVFFANKDQTRIAIGATEILGGLLMVVGPRRIGNLLLIAVMSGAAFFHASADPDHGKPAYILLAALVSCFVLNSILKGGKQDKKKKN